MKHNKNSNYRNSKFKSRNHISPQRKNELRRYLRNFYNAHQIELKRPTWLNLSPLDVDMVFFDLETTGGNPKNSAIIEIGAIKYSKGVEVARFETLVNPGTPIPSLITKMTGITNGMVRAAPKAEDIFDDLLAFIGQSVVVSHGIKGDLSYLLHLNQKMKKTPFDNYYLCTLVIVSNFFPNIGSKTLKGLADYFSVQTSSLHNAIADAECTAQVFWKLFSVIEKNGIKTIEDILKLQADPETLKRLGPGIRNKVLDYAPTTSGVFYILNSQHEISYLAASSNLKKSISSFCNLTDNKELDSLVVDATTCKFERASHYLDALIKEKAELNKISLAIDPRVLENRTHNFVQILIPEDMIEFLTTDPDKVPKAFSAFVKNQDDFNYFNFEEDDEILTSLPEKIDLNEILKSSGEEEKKIPMRKSRKISLFINSKKYKFDRSPISQNYIFKGHLKLGTGYYFGPFENCDEAYENVLKLAEDFQFADTSLSFSERFENLQCLIAILSGKIEQEKENVKNELAREVLTTSPLSLFKKANHYLKLKRFETHFPGFLLPELPASGLAIISLNDFKIYEIFIVVRGQIVQKIRLPFEDGDRLKSSRYFTRIFAPYLSLIKEHYAPIMFTNGSCADIELFAHWLKNKRGEGEWGYFHEFENMIDSNASV